MPKAPYRVELGGTFTRVTRATVTLGDATHVFTFTRLENATE